MSLVQAVGNDNGSGATTLTVSLGAVTAGNLLVVCCGVQSRLVTGVADDVNGAWTEAFAQTNQFAAPGIWYFQNTGSGTPTVTLTFSASTASSAIAWEESGVLTSSAFDKEAHSSTTNSAAWNSGATSTTSQANTVGFGFVSSANAPSGFAGDSGWTALSGTGITSGSRYNSADGNDVFVCRREYTSTGTYSATGTRSAANNWCAGIVIFKQSATTSFNPLRGRLYQPL